MDDADRLAKARGMARRFFENNSGHEYRVEIGDNEYVFHRFDYNYPVCIDPGEQAPVLDLRVYAADAQQDGGRRDEGATCETDRSGRPARSSESGSGRVPGGPGR